jgi:two-component system, OmpR family, sensor histidine kinase VicK
MNLRFFKTVQWKVVSIYLLLILIAMQVIGAYFIREVEKYYVNNFTATLNTQANLLAVNLERYLDIDIDTQQDGSVDNRKADIDYLVNNLFALRGTEVQVIDRNGIVLSTTEEEKGIIGQKNTREEINLALLGTRTELTQILPQSGHRVRVLAIPVKKGNQVLGALYMVSSMESMYQTMSRINAILTTAAFIALLITGSLGILLARTITSPVKEITRQAAAMANGHFNRRVKVYGDDEIGQLAGVFNTLTTRLREAVAQNEEEKEKLSSIISNMSDGVIATDREGQIILINQPACEMLGVRERDILGRGILEIIPVASDGDQEQTIPWNEPFLMEPSQNEENRILKVTFSRLHHIQPIHKGLIAVLQDVTEEEKLDRQRKEFVANVSHELRTPLTTLKSYLEALDEGAVHDPEIASRFVGVTLKETERMIRLVSDLLQLSRLDSNRVVIKRSRLSLNQIISQAIERFAVQFQNKRIQVKLEMAERLPEVWANRDGMTQVLDNFLSNAVKYSYSDTFLFIRAYPREKYAVVEIEDQGVGIPKRDLAHVFERFYRVDKARSREMGGTGLGLSIAREIILSHQGKVSIESEVKQGTKVTFTLPIAEKEEMRDGKRQNHSA